MNNITVNIKDQTGQTLNTVGMPCVPREGEKVAFYTEGNLIVGYVVAVAYLIYPNGEFNIADVTLTNITKYA
jgi:hypothetical protein